MQHDSEFGPGKLVTETSDLLENLVAEANSSENIITGMQPYVCQVLSPSTVLLQYKADPTVSYIITAVAVVK